MVTMLEVVW